MDFNSQKDYVLSIGGTFSGPGYREEGSLLCLFEWCPEPVFEERRCKNHYEQWIGPHVWPKPISYETIRDKPGCEVGECDRKADLRYRKQNFCEEHYELNANQR